MENKKSEKEIVFEGTSLNIETMMLNEKNFQS